MPTNKTIWLFADGFWHQLANANGLTGLGIEITDGTVDVNPANKLSIGGGLALTNPATGEAHLTGTSDGSVNIILDGRGSFIVAGIEIDAYFTFNATITSWHLMADTSGSISLDLRKDAFGSFPPTSGDSIVASAPPALSSADHNSSSTLTGWTTTVNAGDVIRTHVTSCSGISRITLALNITRT